MLYISHRGNIYGKDINRENTVDAIEECLSLDINVEIDIWFINFDFYLGHDEPINKMPREYLFNKQIWIHAKNSDALCKLKEYNAINYFWHNIDNYTLTSSGYIWTYPGKTLLKNSIAVLPEIANYTKNDLINCAGICSDEIIRYINAKNY